MGDPLDLEDQGSAKRIKLLAAPLDPHDHSVDAKVFSHRHTPLPPLPPLPPQAPPHSQPHWKQAQPFPSQRPLQHLDQELQPEEHAGSASSPSMAMATRSPADESTNSFSWSNSAAIFDSCWTWASSEELAPPSTQRISPRDSVGASTVFLSTVVRPPPLALTADVDRMGATSSMQPGERKNFSTWVPVPLFYALTRPACLSQT